MDVRATLKHLRLSPRKVRIIADVVRGLDLTDALNRLSLINKRPVRPLMKLLQSALANAEHNCELKKENLFVKEIRVDSGATLYRWMPKAFGRATPLRKKTAYIYVVLGEKKESKVKAKKTKKIATVTVDEKSGDAPVEKVSNETANHGENVDSKKGDIFDVTHKGGFRDEHQRPKNVRKEKGAFKKMFRRKSNMT